MVVAVKLIGMVRTNNEAFFRANIENLTRDWTGGSYLVLSLKTMVPRFRPQISLGCKYNTRKILSFVVTNNTGSTQAGPPYYQFSNVAIRPVAFNLVVYKFL